MLYEYPSLYIAEADMVGFQIADSVWDHFLGCELVEDSAM
jgi:hypothetical protein